MAWGRRRGGPLAAAAGTPPCHTARHAETVACAVRGVSAAATDSPAGVGGGDTADGGPLPRCARQRHVFFFFLFHMTGDGCRVGHDGRGAPRGGGRGPAERRLAWEGDERKCRAWATLLVMPLRFQWWERAVPPHQETQRRKMKTAREVLSSLRLKRRVVVPVPHPRVQRRAPFCKRGSASKRSSEPVSAVGGWDTYGSSVKNFPGERRRSPPPGVPPSPTIWSRPTGRAGRCQTRSLTTGEGEQVGPPPSSSARKNGVRRVQHAASIAEQRGRAVHIEREEARHTG